MHLAERCSRIREESCDGTDAFGCHRQVSATRHGIDAGARTGRLRLGATWQSRRGLYTGVRNGTGGCRPLTSPPVSPEVPTGSFATIAGIKQDGMRSGTLAAAILLIGIGLFAFFAVLLRLT